MGLKMFKSRYLIIVFVVFSILWIAGCQSSSEDDKSSNKSISYYYFGSENNTALTASVTCTISGTDISCNVPYGTDVSALVATFSYTGKQIQVGSVDQTSSSTSNDFTSPVTYTVTAEDDSIQNYVVTVSIASSSDKQITSFKLLAEDNSALSSDVDGTIDETAKTISLSVPYGTDKTSLVPTIAFSGDSISPESKTEADFSNSVNYTVTAADGTTQEYVVTVTTMASADKSITSFKLLAEDNAALSTDITGSISEAGKTITIAVPNTTNVTALKPTIVHTGNSISPASGTATDFSNDVTYTVTAQDESTQDYVASITLSLPSGSKFGTAVFGTDIF